MCRNNIKMGEKRANLDAGLELIMFLLLEVTLLFILFSFFSGPISGAIGDNVTVVTSLTVGQVNPEVLNVTVDYGNESVSLTANGTQTVICEALVRDWNNESTFSFAWGELFEISVSNQSGNSDSNYHYKNSSCNITADFTSWYGVSDTDYLAAVNCSFDVQYFSDPGNWNCTVSINDTYNSNDTNSDNITMGELLAVGLPSTINYGTVNATYVSSENITNVSNYGNVEIDLDLSGWAVTEGDGLAMNCTQGTNKTIIVQHEKYNLTASNII